MNILLVTGTDTGVGKTVVTSLTIRNLLSRGFRVAALKPIETGCSESAKGLFAADAAMLATAIHGDDSRVDEHVLFKYRNPVAPLMAMRMEGGEITSTDLTRPIQERAESCDLLIVEGAGGILVPIIENYSYVDLARECQMSIVVVVGSRLGAGNHSALTFELRKGKGLNLLGYVFNDLHASRVAEDPSIASNRQLVREIGEIYRLPELGYLPEFKATTPDQFWAVSQSVEVTSLADNLIKQFNLTAPEK